MWTVDSLTSLSFFLVQHDVAIRFDFDQNLEEGKTDPEEDYSWAENFWLSELVKGKQEALIPDSLIDAD